MTLQNPQTLYEISKLFKSEKKAICVLAAVKSEALSAEEIVDKTGISPIECHRILRKLRELGLMRLVKNSQTDNSTNTEGFCYQSQFDDDFIGFKNGRVVARFPTVLHLSDGRKIDVKAMFES